MDKCSREDFERNFFLFKEKEVYFSTDLDSDTFNSLLRIRYLPNGRIDFLTVDESARCLVNTMLAFDQDFILKNKFEEK